LTVEQTAALENIHDDQARAYITRLFAAFPTAPPNICRMTYHVTAQTNWSNEEDAASNLDEEMSA